MSVFGTPNMPNSTPEPAVEHGDDKLLAVAGFSLAIPCADLTANEAEQRFGLIQIEATLGGAAQFAVSLRASPR